MTNIIRLGLILMCVTLIAAGALSGVNKMTKPKIAAIKIQKKVSSLNTVLPGASTGVIDPVVRNGNEIYYKGYADTAKTNLIGYAIAAAGKGYSSTIVTMVGVNLDGRIGAVKIMEQKETPGLGTKIEKVGPYQGKEMPWYQQLSLCRVADLAVDKDGGEINSVTGATISSRAVVKSVKQALLFLEKELGGFVSASTEASHVQPVQGEDK